MYQHDTSQKGNLTTCIQLDQAAVSAASVHYECAPASEMVDSTNSGMYEGMTRKRSSPRQTEGDPSRWAHKRFVLLAGKANQKPMLFEARLRPSRLSLAISFDCDHCTARSCAVGLPLPRPAITLYPLCSATVVSCLSCCSCNTTTTTTTNTFFTSLLQPTIGDIAPPSTARRELRGASFTSTRDVKFAFFFQGSCPPAWYYCRYSLLLHQSPLYTSAPHINLTTPLPAWITKYNGIRYRPDNNQNRRLHSYDRSQGIRL